MEMSFSRGFSPGQMTLRSSAPMRCHPSCRRGRRWFSSEGGSIRTGYKCENDGLQHPSIVSNKKARIIYGISKFRLSSLGIHLKKLQQNPSKHLLFETALYAAAALVHALKLERDQSSVTIYKTPSPLKVHFKTYNRALVSKNIGPVKK